MGKWCLLASMAHLYVSMLPWPIYMFFEMRLGLGTSDSGERLLSFGLLDVILPSSVQQKNNAFN